MATQKIIFVVGNSRSGTTMLGRAFDAHSEINTFPELQIFERLIAVENMHPCAEQQQESLEILGAKILKTVRNGVFSTGSSQHLRSEIKDIIVNAAIKTPMQLYREILDRETIALGKCISCEQTPRYLFVGNEILDAFPDAYIVHIYRDPRDVLLSQKNRWRRRFLSNQKIPIRRTLLAWCNYHPEITARLWGSVIREASHLNKSQRFSEVCYETLLMNPEATLRDLCEKIGVRFEISMLNVRREGSSLRSDSNNEATGFDPSRIGSWASGGLSDAEITICEGRISKLMYEKGYLISNVNSSLHRRLFIYFLLPFKLLLAILLNATRFHNLWKTVARRL